MTHYVYTIWRNSTPLYVGCTNNLPRRMREHSWRLLGATWVAWVEFDDRDEALAAESERIAKLMPRGNVRDNPGCRTVDFAIERERAHLEWMAWYEAEFPELGGAA